MKVKKKLISAIIAVVALTLMLLLASCSLFGKNKEVVAPTVENISMLKTTPNYIESAEYAYNHDKDNAMGIESGGSFILSIEYNNPQKYTISYVTINDEKIMRAQFEEGSTKTNTLIKITVPELDDETELSYSIKNIYFNTGSETKRIKFSEDMKLNYNVNVAPKYNLILNYQNTDRRSTSQKPMDDVSQATVVAFGAEMSTVGVLDKDYAKPTGLPAKEGGWVFEGWFTEPHGQGIEVKGVDKYYFWSDITLYAHFTRLFEYEIVELEEPIVHSYTGYIQSGSNSILINGTKTFTSGVIITKDNSRGKYPSISIYDTIVDEKVVVSDSGRTTVTSSEYPVIKVANRAFMNKDNITELYIGKYVEEIGYYSFYNCFNITKATFSNEAKLKYIGDYAFGNTKAMGITSAFTLPATVEYLGNFAFRYSGWSNTNNNGINESILHIKPSYKFIGFGCFLDTGFSKVVFEPGCYFESQIGYTEGKEMESNGCWTDIRSEYNRIGGNLFADCNNLTEVEFLSDDGENNAINIIPDRAFDAGQYTVKGIERLYFAEGIEIIGNMAFNYQTKLSMLDFPASVKEIGRNAFYNCSAVTQLNFPQDSRLEILYSNCFGNLASIDRVVITSSVFRKYGNGPFSGCGRLKSIEFPNINDSSTVPMGFHKDENKDEVYPQHYYSDLMFGTFETGSTETAGTSYSLPTRVFCKNGVMNDFKNSLLNGKEMYVTVNGKDQSTGRDIYNDRIFVHNIDLIKTYINPSASVGEESEVQIALQEIYDRSSHKPVAYSIVYWSIRSISITLPSSIDGLQYPITELAMYALPTSVRELTIPGNITRLEHDALNGCYLLETVRFLNKDTLEYVGDYAFFGTRLTSFEGGSSLRVIGMNAFMQCKALKWVDLRNTAIVNPPVNGRDETLKRYKYRYEIEGDNKNATDRYNVLYDGAFQGCSSLNWVALPTNLKQVSNAMFTGCTALRTVIIPCVGVSTSINQTDDFTFYFRSLPTAIYDDKAIPFIKIYVPASQLNAHKTIFLPTEDTYGLIDDAPSHG